MKNHHIHMVSTQLGSLGEISKDLYEELSKEFIVTREWEYEYPEKHDILLVHFLNLAVMEHMNIFNSFHRKILIQPVDGTKIKRQYIQMMNLFDIIITPAHAGKKILEENGTTRPIKVIPNYFKGSLFTKDIYTEIDKYIPKNKTIFYHESSFDNRKGIELMYEGFTRAFADTSSANDAVMIVKDLPYNSHSFKNHAKLKKQTIKLQKSFKNPPTILKFSCFLTEAELKTLWYASDVYLALSKIEGFGIPSLRMLALNKQILALENQNNGYSDYLNSNNSYLIPTIQVKAEGERMWLYGEENYWGVPNINNVINSFREVFKNLETGYKRNNMSFYNNFYTEYKFETIYQQYKKVIINE